MFNQKEKLNMIWHDIYSPSPTQTNDGHGKLEEQCDFFVTLCGFLTVGNDVKGEQHIRNTMSHLCQIFLAK